VLPLVHHGIFQIKHHSGCAGIEHLNHKGRIVGRACHLVALVLAPFRQFDSPAAAHGLSRKSVGWFSTPAGFRQDSLAFLDERLLPRCEAAMERGAADKAANLARRKSSYRQLPVFGRLAYPVRAEATKHVLPGCKSLGRPVAVRAAVGTIWETSKFGGLNINGISAASKSRSAKSRVCGLEAGSRPTLLLGEADDTKEETGKCTSWDRRGMGSGT
jgi:hypothetical protein